MDLSQIIDQWKPVELLRQLARDSEPVFLVGGAVRDLILQKNHPHDLDVVMLNDVRPLARRLAKALRGDFYMLDEERNTARVLAYSEADGNMVIDFARARGNNLEEDLWERDFSINALAMPLTGEAPPRVIDPTGGMEDLRMKVLRQCKASSIQDDPIRVMRGVRLALALGFKLDAETWQTMKATAPLLSNISAERRRDELFRILEGRRVSSALRLLDQAGALTWVTPELLALKGVQQTLPHTQDVWEHTLSCVDELESVLKALAAPYDEGSVSNLRMGMAVLRLGKYRQQLREYLEKEITPGRSIRGLLFLSAMYHDAGKPVSAQWDGDRIRFFGHEAESETLIAVRGRALALSQSEINQLSIIAREHMRVHHLAKSSGTPSRRAVHRFFRDTGATGIDICLLSLADSLATHRPEIPQPVWLAELEVCQTLLEAWWDRHQELVSPPRLITGEDVIRAGVAVGPRVGKALETIVEAQAEGKLNTREEALIFLEKWAAEEVNLDQATD